MRASVYLFVRRGFGRRLGVDIAAIFAAIETSLKARPCSVPRRNCDPGLRRIFPDATQPKAGAIFQSRQCLANGGGFQSYCLAHDSEREWTTMVALHPMLSLSAPASNSAVVTDTANQDCHHERLGAGMLAATRPPSL